MSEGEFRTEAVVSVWAAEKWDHEGFGKSLKGHESLGRLLDEISASEKFEFSPLWIFCFSWHLED